MIDFSQIGGSAAREAIDVRDRFEVMRQAQQDLDRRFDGAMFYEPRGATEYLLRRRSRSQSKTSLGPRSPALDAVLHDFDAGKSRLESRVKALRTEIEARAGVIAAHGLGRVPELTARILRRLDTAGWLGERLIVVGTNALFAYEAAAGLRIAAEATATEDIDVLFDARRRISLGARAAASRGLVDLLRKVDRSFGAVQRRGFRAVNDAGYMVDLIEPHHGDPMRHAPGALSTDPDDVQAVAIAGLEWLLNAPRFEAVAFDARGLPVRIPTIDPRAFAVHKLWVSQRPDREGLKRRRDRLQAEIVARIARDHLGLPLQGPDLSAVPRALVDELLEMIQPGPAPEW